MVIQSQFQSTQTPSLNKMRMLMTKVKIDTKLIRLSCHMILVQIGNLTTLIPVL